MKLVVALLVVAVSSSAYAEREDVTCHERAGKITASFGSETSLRDLATWVMGFSCKNIVIDAEAMRYGARLVVMAPKPMTAKQALALFTDAVTAVGLVVEVKKDTIVVKLGPRTPARTCDPGATSMSTPTPMPAPAGPSDAELAELDKLMDASIKRIDDTHYEVKGSLIDHVLANPLALAKGARVVPSVKDGKPDGFKMYAIRPGSLYARVGLRNGDTLLDVNGMELTSADKALEVYTRVREATQLTVSLVRRGQPVTVQIKIIR
jgi:hypothetical protein